MLEVSASCTSPLTSRRLVPAVPYESPDQTHATYTPDTAHTVNQAPCELILKFRHDLNFDVIRVTTRQQWFRVIRLSDPYLPNLFSTFPQRSQPPLLMAAA